MLRRVGAHEHVVFGGRVPADPRNFVERAMLRDTSSESPDRRGWQEIDNWAKLIGKTLRYREGRDRRQG